MFSRCRQRPTLPEVSYSIANLGMDNACNWHISVKRPSGSLYRNVWVSLLNSWGKATQSLCMRHRISAMASRNLGRYNWSWVALHESTGSSILMCTFVSMLEHAYCTILPHGHLNLKMISQFSTIQSRLARCLSNSQFYIQGRREVLCWSCKFPHLVPGFELSKNKWGLTSAYSLSLSLHTGDSASLTTAGVETDPPGYPRASCLGG
jgi:hypothetical protein